jgi:cobalamin transport system substrate-binding protein
VAAALLSGCKPPAVPGTGPGTNSPGIGFPLTVSDDSGRQVTIPAAPQRIVSLAPAHTELLYALGIGDRVVAADTYSDYPPEARARAKLNCWPRPPLESIVALKPDLVLILTQGDDFIQQMERLRIPVLKLFPETYEKALEEIALLGRVTGTEREADRLVGTMRSRSISVEERLRGVKRKRVLYELDATDPARPFVAWNGGFYGAILRMAGGENVFDDSGAPSGQVSLEQVVARDPEVILLGDTQSPSHPQSRELVFKRPGWGRITAVRKRQVFPVESERITRPGPRLVEGLEEIARILHPDRFRAKGSP